MKTFEKKSKMTTPPVRRGRTPVLPSFDPAAQIQRAQIRQVLRPPRVQAKPKIGQPNDIYEQEADRVAEQVMRMPEPHVQRQAEDEELIQTRPLAEQVTPLVQRQVEPEEEEEEEEEEILQAKDVSGKTPEVTPDLESRIQSLKRGGRPLSHSERAFFEPRFGTDFSGVRVHTDGQAAGVARDINAQAFTVGNNVVFGSGGYSSNSPEGQRLLGHELVHVLQQAGMPVCNRSINCTDGENTKEEDSLVLKEINGACEARNIGSSDIHRSLHSEKVQTSQSLMKQTASKESKSKKLVKISVPEELPESLQVCVPVAERFLDQVWKDYNKWYYGVRIKTDYLRWSAAFWKKPENIQFDPLRHKGCKLVIQKLLPKKFSRKFIEELRDVYSDHVMRGKTKSLWIISDVLGVKKLEVGFHPYEIKVFAEAGFGILFFSQQEAHVGIKRWSKDKKRIIWQDDFLFNVSAINLGKSFNFSPPIGGKPGTEIMKPVCLDVKESNVSYSGDSDWEPFESRLGWSPDEFKNATISVVSGPSAELLFIEGKLFTRVDLCHSRKGCIKLPADKIGIKLTGVGAKVVELGKGIVTGGFFLPEFCDPNQIISEEDIETLKWMAREERALLYRAGEWQLTESQRTQLKNWLLSDPINVLLRAPASELKIIGHASPFWATANTYEEMMRENKHLSFMRAVAVSNFVDDTMKDALAADVYMSHVGCEEYIKQFGRPRNFRIYRREYRMFQRVDLILNDNLVFTVEF
jgi:hypothetical protein